MSRLFFLAASVGCCYRLPSSDLETSSRYLQLTWGRKVGSSSGIPTHSQLWWESQCLHTSAVPCPLGAALLLPTASPARFVSLLLSYFPKNVLQKMLSDRGTFSQRWAQLKWRSTRWPKHPSHYLTPCVSTGTAAGTSYVSLYHMVGDMQFLF